MKRITLFLILFLCFGCRKQIIKEGQKHLPRETSKGKGVFACHVDDQTYILKKQNAVTYNSTTGYLALNVIGKSGKEFRLFVYEGIFYPGMYQFDLTGEEYISAKSLPSYGIATDGVNQLVIKVLDTEFNTISGTFNFDLINEQNETKKVRNGRFDLKIKIIS